MPQRRAIYALYQRYGSMKAIHRDWDVADLTLHLHKQLHAHGFPNPSKFNFIYVDEASAAQHTAGIIKETGTSTLAGCCSSLCKG